MAKPITVEQFSKDIAEMWKRAVKESYEDLLQEAIKIEREACARDAEWCIQNYIEQHIPERIRART